MIHAINPSRHYYPERPIMLCLMYIDYSTQKQVQTTTEKLKLLRKLRKHCRTADSRKTWKDDGVSDCHNPCPQLQLKLLFITRIAIIFFNHTAIGNGR